MHSAANLLHIIYFLFVLEQITESEAPVKGNVQRIINKHKTYFSATLSQYFQAPEFLALSCFPLS